VIIVLLIKLLYFIIGYLEIEVEGFYIERFLNKCATQNIKIWNLKRYGECLLKGNIKISDFKALKKIIKSTGCKIRIKRKSGINFKIHKYRKRKAFLIFPILIIIILFFLSSFIWNIEIVGDEKINREKIISILEESNIKIGTKKKNINKEIIANKIRLENSGISWVGIKVKGTNLIIEFVSSREKPEIIDKDEYCNIVADKDGIVEDISVQSGMAVVKKGDVIKKGEILVKGEMEGKYTGIRNVHSKANIIAKVWFSKSRKIDKKKNIKKQTGREEKYYKISMNNFSINFNKRVSNFKNYDTINNSNRLRIFNNFYLPITFTEVRNIEMKSEPIINSIDKIKNNTILELREILKEETNGLKIVDEQIVTDEKDDFIEIKVIYVALDNIGVEEKLE